MSIHREERRCKDTSLGHFNIKKSGGKGEAAKQAEKK